MAQSSGKPTAVDIINSIEKEFFKKSKNKEISLEKQFALNVLIARELLKYNEEVKSEMYYRKALLMNVNEDKSEIYINLINIAQRKEDKKQIQDLYSQSMNYFEKNKKYFSQTNKFFFEAINKKYINEQTKVSQKSLYSDDLKLIDIKTLMIQKKYEKGLSELKKLNLDSSDPFLDAQYDVLNILLKKDKYKNPRCNESYKRNKFAFSYTVRICDVILSYLDSGEVNKDSMNRLKVLFEKKHSDKIFLYESLKDLK
jgi:hypothetical protein